MKISIKLKKSFTLRHLIQMFFAGLGTGALIWDLFLRLRL